MARELNLGAGSIQEIEVVGSSLESVFRRFRRCSESEILGEKLPCRLRMAVETCTGCRNTVISVLVSLRDQGLLSYLEGKTLITGTPEIEPDDPPQRLAIGRCSVRCAPSAFMLTASPENSEIIDALFTGFNR